MRKYTYTLWLLMLFFNNGYAQELSAFEFGNSSFYLKWLEPSTIIKEVGKHEKLELGLVAMEGIDNKINEFIETGKNGLNPYNPEDISVEITFVSPTYRERIIYGFYYEPFIRNGESWQKQPTKYNWRIRFSPDEIGKWTFSVKIITKEKTIESLGVKFNCIESSNKGVLKKDNNSGRYLCLSETDEPFFTIGHNIAHSAYYKLTPQKAEQHKQWLSELAANGGNFFRLEMGAQNSLPDWNDYKNYTKKMPQMWEFDELIEHAQHLGLYFILFRHHTEVMEGESWDVSRWENNPYKIGFDLKDRKTYFTDEEVMKWQKNTLRYIFSRWGYSSSFAFYEYQEIDNWFKDLKKETGFSDKEAIVMLKNWMVKQKEYIKNELGYTKKLFINTYASTPDWEYSANSDGMFANSDVIGFHKYGQRKEINYTDKYDKAVVLFDTWKKPLIIEEMGVDAYGSSNLLPIYKCSNVEFHNSIWSTSFMGGIGTGMNWWWDRGFHDFEYYKDYNAVSSFFKGENLNSENYIPQKWHSKISIKRALIENYALINKDETKVLGWVHNATNYWRNLDSPCLEELKQEGKFKTPYKLKDGVVIGGEEKEKTDFTRDTDAYSKKGVQDVTDKVFEIKGLKSSSMFGKSNWYEVNYYSTITGKKATKQILKTTAWGKLKLKYPNINEPDFSYKIVYLGESKKQPK